MDGILMVKVFASALWIIQVACLVIILYCCWQLLDRTLFALVTASIVLFMTLYIERSWPDEGGT
jgi:hypothetical protein